MVKRVVEGLWFCVVGLPLLLLYGRAISRELRDYGVH